MAHKSGDVTGEAREKQIRALSEEVLRRFQGLRFTLAVAESCTGGGLADALTDVPGSSACFLGGIVAYANQVKERLLGVDPRVLAEQGAVSEPVAMAMAEGVRYVIGSDLGVGITGIAGPEGGTPDKPVGLVYIALASPGRRIVERHVWNDDRGGNKRRSVEAALTMLLAYSEGPLP